MFKVKHIFLRKNQKLQKNDFFSSTTNATNLKFYMMNNMIFFELPTKFESKNSNRSGDIVI